MYIHRSGIISATDGRRAAVCSRLDLFVDQRESSCDHSHTSDARDCAVHNAGLAAVPIIVIDCTLDCRRPTDYLDRLSLVVLTIGVDYRWLAGLTIVRLTFDYRTHYTTLFFMCTSTPRTRSHRQLVGPDVISALAVCNDAKYALAAPSGSSHMLNENTLFALRNLTLYRLVALS